MRKIYYRLAFLTLLIKIFAICMLDGQMTQIMEFGLNPGNLNMYLYQPTEPVAAAGCVLVLHGCTQNASDFAYETGWNVLAEKYGFYTIFAEQNSENHASNCFNWRRSEDNMRDKGEALSLSSMVDYVHKNYATDSNKTFVCGLSAGGAMTTTMLACYPDLFKKGGTWAGLVYQVDSLTFFDTPQDLGDRVRMAFPEYEGTYPSLAIFQGSADAVVLPIHESLLVDQWTNIHGADQIADETTHKFMNNSRVTQNIYYNNSNESIIESYSISDMGHGIAVDPGIDSFQGGQIATYSFDVDFYSTYWMANFFGLLNDGLTNTHDSYVAHNTSAYVDDAGDLNVVSSLKQVEYDLKLIDVGGRVIYEQYFQGEIIISRSHFKENALFVVTVSKKNGHQLFSEIKYGF